MPENDLELQLQTDCDSLREIFDGLNRLEQEWDSARATIQACQRGYFAPDEDDRARQMLLAYRNYRLALYEIIDRYIHHEEIGEPAQQLRGFLIGFAAALTLYAKSLKLIQAYEHVSLVRQKLNEPDAKFGLEAGFFDEILRAYSSVHNYRMIARANRFWRSQRRVVQKSGLASAPNWEWLCQLIRQQRAEVRQLMGKVLRFRLLYDWLVFWQSVFRPVTSARYHLQSFVGGTFAQMRTTSHYEPAITTEVLTRLRGILRPGDVLLIRAERKVTTAILPGFWAHTALYLGSRRELEGLGLGRLPHVQKHWNAILEDGGRYGQVLEAISPRVRLSPLKKCLHADHVAVLRPNVSEPQLAEAIDEAFGHLGKPYDFEFDFNVTSRIVCTELIYRSYHRRAGIEFPLVKRLGRFTLTCDDIINLFLNSIDRHSGVSVVPFQLAALVLRGADDTARFIPIEQGEAVLRSIQKGLRPTAVKDPGQLVASIPAHG